MPRFVLVFLVSINPTLRLYITQTHDTKIACNPVSSTFDLTEKARDVD